MNKTFTDIIKLVLPISDEKEEQLETLSQFLGEKDIEEIKYWLKMDKLSTKTKKIGSKNLEANEEYPQIKIEAEDPDPELENLVQKWNEEIEHDVQEEVFKKFSLHAGSKIVDVIAPNIIGMRDVKEAVMLQLFANERVHVLLLGDPGTGKTDILRAAEELAPVASFGLGSGTSGAGLTVTVKGKETVKGLLPMADGGLCCVDELNLMKDRDRAGLLNAMEKGFVSYDKGNKHIQVDADVRVLASANPKGDQFAGFQIETLKKQLPFDPALLSRFHLVFLVKRPDTEEFKEISKKIVKDERKEVPEKDKRFVKDYINYVEDIDVTFDKSLEPMITDFVESVKENEEEYLIDVSPRLVVGIMRMSKASARISMRDKVTETDVENVIELVKKSLKLDKAKKKEK